MTFSVAARCDRTGMLGLAVSSSSPAVAARCAYARAGIGVVASQNITDPTLGPRGLELLSLGLDAEHALAALVRTRSGVEYRQLSMVDSDGNTATYSGPHTLGLHAAAQGEQVVCCGNLLANTDVPRQMVHAFLASDGHLGARLLASLRAGLDAGGEAGPVHSAGLLVVREVSWPVADLRVDWHEHDPILALEQLWAVYAPQLDDYVMRALTPQRAPGFGVPGDP